MAKVSFVGQVAASIAEAISTILSVGTVKCTGPMVVSIGVNGIKAFRMASEL